MPEQGEEEPDKSGEPTTVKDPESYINKRRLKGIFDIRDEMREVRKKVKVAPYQAGVSKYESVSIYRALVDSYIVETEPLLRRYKGGLELLEDKDFGTASVCPQYQRNPDSRHRSGPRDRYRVHVGDDPTVDAEKVTVSTEPEPTIFELTGLLSVVTTPDPLVSLYEFTASAQGRTRKKTITYRCEAQVSYNTLDTMVRTLNNFLGQIGLEVDPEEADPEDGFLDL
jgi:hypothetical protein